MLSDGDAMLDAALNGLGVAQLPTWLIQEQLVLFHIYFDQLPLLKFR